MERAHTLGTSKVHQSRLNFLNSSDLINNLRVTKRDSEVSNASNAPSIKRRTQSLKQKEAEKLVHDTESDENSKSDEEFKDEEEKDSFTGEEAKEEAKSIDGVLCKPTKLKNRKLRKDRREYSFIKKRVMSIDMREDADVIETSFTTKDSGNWRLNLVKTSTIARTGDRIRRDLVSKLTMSKIWLTPAQKPEGHQTVLIYDWDDTLL